MAKTIVLISGGNRGIGLEIVKALLSSAPSESSSAPYHIYLGSRSLERGQEVAASLETSHGNTVSAIQLDITSPESVNAAVATVKAESGRIDVLINNAGVNYEDMADEAEKMQLIYDINVIGPMRMTDAFKTLLLTKPAEDGKVEKRIIYVTSSMGSVTSRHDPNFHFYVGRYNAYRCSKAALNMLVACHRFDFKEAGVKVHGYDPGWAATELGGLDPKALSAMGAIDPADSGRSCADVVKGKRDNEQHVMVSVDGHTFPW
ncbi:NAD(P)-binding protein [Astrocystis sublimbata]|nr:NAD(P)-binding protein [Astrocystis sublimbata]